MLKVSIGWSDEPDTLEATDVAMEMAVKALDGQVPQAALVYVSIDLDMDVVSQTLRARFPGIPVVGCTTDGEIAGGEGFLEDSLVVTLFASDQIEFSVGIGRDAIANPQAAALQAVTQARAGSAMAPALCVALLEGLGTNFRHLVDGLRDALGADVPVVVFMMHGPLVVSSGVSTGYTPLGQSHVVTKAEGAVVHQIDHRPAADLYAEYLQQPSFFCPLAVHDLTRKSLVLSSPLHTDPDTGALHLVNPVAEKSTVQLATASREEIVDAARNAVGQAFANFDGGAVDAALLFSCAGRRTGEEYAAIQHVIGEAVPTAGFYCYGEISPDTKGGPSLTHTNAFVAVLLGTSEGAGTQE